MNSWLCALSKPNLPNMRDEFDTGAYFPRAETPAATNDSTIVGEYSKWAWSVSQNFEVWPSRNLMRDVIGPLADSAPIDLDSRMWLTGCQWLFHRWYLQILRPVVRLAATWKSTLTHSPLPLPSLPYDFRVRGWAPKWGTIGRYSCTKSSEGCGFLQKVKSTYSKFLDICSCKVILILIGRTTTDFFYPLLNGFRLSMGLYLFLFSIGTYLR